MLFSKRSTLIPLLLALAAVLFSCEEKVEQPTRSDEEMARIMADLAIADAGTYGISGYQRDSLVQIYYKQVLELHRISLEEYEKNLHLLSQDIYRLEAVVTQAKKILEPKEVEKPKGRIDTTRRNDVR